MSWVVEKNGRHFVHKPLADIGVRIPPSTGDMLLAYANKRTVFAKNGIALVCFYAEAINVEWRLVRCASC